MKSYACDKKCVPCVLVPPGVYPGVCAGTALMSHQHMGSCTVSEQVNICADLEIPRESSGGAMKCPVCPDHSRELPESWKPSVKYSWFNPRKKARPQAARA